MEVWFSTNRGPRTTLSDSIPEWTEEEEFNEPVDLPTVPHVGDLVFLGGRTYTVAELWWYPFGDPETDEEDTQPWVAVQLALADEGEKDREAAARSAAWLERQRRQ